MSIVPASAKEVDEGPQLHETVSPVAVEDDEENAPGLAARRGQRNPSAFVGDGSRKVTADDFKLFDESARRPPRPSADYLGAVAGFNDLAQPQGASSKQHVRTGSRGSLMKFTITESSVVQYSHSSRGDQSVGEVSMQIDKIFPGSQDLDQLNQLEGEGLRDRVGAQEAVESAQRRDDALAGVPGLPQEQNARRRVQEMSGVAKKEDDPALETQLARSSEQTGGLGNSASDNSRLRRK